jgi:hypothetical protein
VTIENRPSPLDRVADSNSRRLRSGPEFEVFRPIVITHTIAVVNRFAGLQVPTEQLLDNENVFEDVRTRSCSRVVGHPHHDVAGLVQGSAALPVSIRRFRNCSACSARVRLCLPRPTTRTGRFAAAGRAPQVSRCSTQPDRGERPFSPRPTRDRSRFCSRRCNPNWSARSSCSTPPRGTSKRTITRSARRPRRSTRWCS